MTIENRFNALMVRGNSHGTGIDSVEVRKRAFDTETGQMGAFLPYQPLTKEEAENYLAGLGLAVLNASLAAKVDALTAEVDELKAQVDDLSEQLAPKPKFVIPMSRLMRIFEAEGMDTDAVNALKAIRPGLLADLTELGALNLEADIPGTDPAVKASDALQGLGFTKEQIMSYKLPGEE